MDVDLAQKYVPWVGPVVESAFQKGIITDLLIEQKTGQPASQSWRHDDILPVEMTFLGGGQFGYVWEVYILLRAGV
jgi:hypothetical protein